MLPTASRSSVPGELLSVATVVDPRPGRVVVEVVGEVDAYTAPVLDACLRSQASRHGLRVLVVDLGRVTFLGAAGAGALAQAEHRCRTRGARLVIRTGGHRCVIRPLQLVGLGGVAVDAAEVEEVRPPGRRTTRRPGTTARRVPARRSRQGCR